ncbi:S41 family peptidase [Pedobacter nanyangensis]|uniref:S41 family peptidase n=1 Tax=Pedobacter nanyangensis TaxID=1562389 RepID=UPI0013B3AC11|nr:S41 family peptidase [Pedobacter nanyangensis]
MKNLSCTLIIVLLGLVAFAQQDQNQADLEALYQAVQKMPSYKKLLKGKSNYQQLYQEVKKKLKDADERTAFMQLSRLLYFINDNHLGFYRTPDSALKTAYVTLPVNIDSLRKQLAQKDKNELEGIYYMGDYDFGLYTTDQQHYKLILLKNGILMGEIIKTPYGGYDGVQYGGRHVPYQLIKNVRLINGQLIGMPFVKSRAKRFSTLAKSAESFEYKDLNEDVGYLRLSSFSADNANVKKSEAFFKTINGRLASKYLIVDLRNNMGGAYKTSQKFIDLLKKYKGKIFILQNAQTVSNAEQVIIALKGQKNIVTLGEQTKGMITFGSNYGKTILLPSGRFTFYPTDMIGVDRDLAYESKGVDPDVPLNPYQGDWIEQALDYIKKTP